MLKQLYVQQIDIQRMQNKTRQLRDNQSMKNNSIPLSALTYNAPAGYAPLTKTVPIYIFTTSTGAEFLPSTVELSIKHVTSIWAN